MSNALNTPVEIDTAIAATMLTLSIIERDIATQERYRDSESAYTRHSFDQDKLNNLLADLSMGEFVLSELEAKYTGWTRYYHVTNANGHIHNSTHCSSCFPTTQYNWRTDLSGDTEEQIVAKLAYDACSVCLPIAPAEQKAARLAQTNDAKAARKAERDAKNAAKDAKAHARAVKLVDKVQKAIRDLTCEGEDFEAIEVFRAEFSEYGKDGRKSIYGISWKDEYASLKITSTTEDLLMFIVTDDRWNKPNAAVQAELRERGLLV